METRLIALDDVADTIICEVVYLSFTEDASGNQTSQSYVYLSRQMEFESFLVADNTNLVFFNSSLLCKFCKTNTILRVPNDSC